MAEIALVQISKLGVGRHQIAFAIGAGMHGKGRTFDESRCPFCQCQGACIGIRGMAEWPT